MVTNFVRLEVRAECLITYCCYYYHCYYYFDDLRALKKFKMVRLRMAQLSNQQK
jgi:hypothetical protein